MERTDEVSTMKEKFGKLGLFTIELWRSQIRERHEPTSEFKVSTLEAVPEKALKGQALDVATTSVLRPMVGSG